MMKVKKIVILGVCGLSLIALIVGLCVFFLTNKIVDAVPSGVYIQKVDDKYMLFTDYNSNFNYRFKIQKFIGEDYITLSYVDSTTNSIDLIENNVEIKDINKYCFSACYISSSGSVGEFCDDYECKIDIPLNKGVDYSKIVVNEENSTISWEKVEGVDYYDVRVVNDFGESSDYITSNLFFDYSYFDIGNYIAFISVGVYDNGNIHSDFCTGVNFKIEKPNIINSSVWDGNVLSIESFYDVEKFEIYNSSNELVCIIPVEEKNENKYIFNNLSLVINKYFSNNENLFIKSCACNLVLESDLYQIFVSMPND